MRLLAALIGGIACASAAAPLVAQPTTAPATAPVAAPPPRTEVDPQRTADLLALIEGPNAPSARQTGVRELLRLGWAETPRRLAGILSNGSAASRTAVASVLAQQPEHIDTSYVEPLVRMLSDREPGVAAAARGAILACREQIAVPLLRERALDSDLPVAARTEAVAVLGEMTSRDALGALVAVVESDPTALNSAALSALRSTAGLDFEDAAAVRPWWEMVRSLSSEEWLDRQVRRLLSRERQTAATLAATESRLVRSLRDAYGRTPESERTDLLESYLKDAVAPVRLLGLDLVLAGITEGRPPGPELADDVRALMSAADPATREAAARAVASLREPADAERFVALLAIERNASVRPALVSGLGYVGGPSHVELLASLARDTDDPAAPQAVTALGRLAERGVLDSAALDAVATLLLDRTDRCRPEEHALRERLLWAMARVRDSRFVPVFIRSLASGEPGTIRQAAVRGIGAMADAAGLDALAALTSDADAVVRRTVVETLAAHASTDAHVQALWGRLSAGSEPEEVIRDAAWRGVTTTLARRSGSEIEGWVGRLPDNGPTRARRSLELLQLAERAYLSDPREREALGLVRHRIGGALERLAQPADAAEAYRQALTELLSVRSDRAAPVAADLLRTALMAGRYDERVQSALAGESRPDGAAVWAAFAAPVRELAERDATGADNAVAMLTTLSATPPAVLGASELDQLSSLLQQVRGIRDRRDAERVQSAAAALRGNPRDAEARAGIERLGPRAAPALQSLLREVAGENGAAAEYERVLHDLLRAARPDWPGYDEAADPPAKLRALDALSAGAL
ncbi:MAG: HEAT repeat domain-containing protein [Planctomycetia bacterium]|nr:MAG: HEAT repeat domain-containing protein [Planctomycetia bacterium]